MPRTFNQSHPASRRSALFSLGVLTLGLAGCAQFPSLDALSMLKPASGYQSSSSFAAPVSAWPEDHWWQSYRDKQLDALIEEALRDSPDMAVAAARLRRAEAVGQIAGAALLPDWAPPLLGRDRRGQRLRAALAARLLRGSAPLFRAALGDGIAARACQRMGCDPQSLLHWPA